MKFKISENSYADRVDSLKAKKEELSRYWRVDIAGHSQVYSNSFLTSSVSPWPFTQIFYKVLSLDIN